MCITFPVAIGTTTIIGTIAIMVAGDHGDTGTGQRTMATGATVMPIMAGDAAADEMIMGVMTMDATTMDGITMDGAVMEGLEVATTVQTRGSETTTYTATIRSVPGSPIPAITNHVCPTGREKIPGRQISPARTICDRRTTAV